MTITKEQLKEIDGLREKADVAELSRITKKPKSTIYYILNTGACPAPVAGKILKFYKKRKQERDALPQISKDND